MIQEPHTTVRDRPGGRDSLCNLGTGQPHEQEEWQCTTGGAAATGRLGSIFPVENSGSSEAMDAKGSPSFTRPCWSGAFPLTYRAQVTLVGEVRLGLPVLTERDAAAVPFRQLSPQ